MQCVSRLMTLPRAAPGLKLARNFSNWPFRRAGDLHMTWFPRNIPIRRKLTIVVLASSTAALLVASAAMFAFQLYTFRQTFMRDLASDAEIISSNTTAAITFSDKDAARDILASLRVTQHVES